MSELASQRPAINSWSPEFLEAQYQLWKSNPTAVEEQWRSFFQGFELGAASDVVTPTAPAAAQPPPNGGATSPGVYELVQRYREEGHYHATLDPLGRPRAPREAIDPANFGLTEADLGKAHATGVAGVSPKATLREVIAHLQAAYCGNLGTEFTHVTNRVERRWLQDRLETLAGRATLDRDVRRDILRRLNESESFEVFLQTRKGSEKRFSLEGSETLIPMVMQAIETAGELGVIESVLGMAHRGRLNVLAHVAGKPYNKMFAEFEGNYSDASAGGGDVKYHKGYSNTIKTASGSQIYLTVATNPSHLEFVNPVVLGRARAKQRLHGDKARKKVLPFLIHGDAAFAGQGIVAETFQMMTLPGYSTGGTIHFVINNQVGFTTDPINSRSSIYCSDFAKITGTPVLHVNGDDADLCVEVARICVDYRQTFGRDIVVDMWCYRKHGHNESDEPSFTQPTMYEIIRKRDSVCALYRARAIAEGVLTAEEAEAERQAQQARLERAFEEGQRVPTKRNHQGFSGHWQGLDNNFSFDVVETAAPADRLKEIAKALAILPETFTPNRKVAKLLAERRDNALNGAPMDWGTVELLAYGSLLDEGVAVRLTGQDVQRGTFSHRHAVATDTTNDQEFTPLNFIREGQAHFCIHDSLLSEAAVLGYEYGYSLGDPKMLVLWEAQFGDFGNGAQVIIDQFLASAEKKWERASGLVLLLPHGYEGQGPEHSSARLERFLQLCADENMQVANVTTPAQYFHLVRRQMKRPFRKPLILMSPKSLLRFDKATSVLGDLTSGAFKEIMDDPAITDPASVKRVILCSGKVYYDLIARRAEVEQQDTAIIRLEQLYPLQTTLLQTVLAPYRNAAEFVWCQEEPQNMGAWSHIAPAIEAAVGLRLSYAGRPESSTPATGLSSVHKRELASFLSAAIPAIRSAPVASAV